MKHVALNLLFLVNFILVILYMALSVNMYRQSVTGTVALFLSSLMLADIAYISSCNIRENKVISLFCGLLALHGWYILLSVPENAVTGRVFSVLSPAICFVSVNFVLMFLFQDSGYKFKKAVNICLSGTWICSMAGILVSDEIFALLYGIQFLTGWFCLFFIAACHRKRVFFVVRAEWKCILFSLVAVSILFLAYYLATMGVRMRLSNFGMYLPVLLFAMSIHGIILKEHGRFPLSTVFSRRQSVLLLLFAAVTCGLSAMASGNGFWLFFLMLDVLSAFAFACNIVLDFNIRHGKNKIPGESKYLAALRQLQLEERLNLEFADFLHDDILQDLLSVKNMMNKADQTDVRQIITETLDNMNMYIRKRMHDYHPALLAKLTIKENYQNLLEYISQSFPHRNIRIAFDCPDALFLVEPYNVFVYRLLKELVTNVYKHSTGGRAWISLAQEDGTIRLCVRDDGSAEAQVLRTAGMSKHGGLALIAGRVHDMDGSVAISGNAPHGVCVQITLPMKGDVSYQYFVSR